MKIYGLKTDFPTPDEHYLLYSKFMKRTPLKKTKLLKKLSGKILDFDFSLKNTS